MKLKAYAGRKLFIDMPRTVIEGHPHPKWSRGTKDGTRTERIKSLHAHTGSSAATRAIRRWSVLERDRPLPRRSDADVGSARDGHSSRTALGREGRTLSLNHVGVVTGPAELPEGRGGVL